MGSLGIVRDHKGSIGIISDCKGSLGIIRNHKGSLGIIGINPSLAVMDFFDREQRSRGLRNTFDVPGNNYKKTFHS